MCRQPEDIKAAATIRLSADAGSTHPDYALSPEKGKSALGIGRGARDVNESCEPRRHWWAKVVWISDAPADRCRRQRAKLKTLRPGESRVSSPAMAGAHC